MALHDIVVGLDGSQASADTLRWAIGLADATSATVRAISTWQMPLVAAMPSAIGGLPSQAFMAAHCSERLATSLQAAGVDREIERAVREGAPGHVLAEETRTADLVVVGRTGSGRRHGVARVAEVLLGSAARHCIHHAHGPVAAVPRDHDWVDNPQVLVGIDGSAASRAALTWAAENLPSGSTIHVVQAVPVLVDALLAVDIGAVDRVVAATERELAESIEAATGHLGDDVAGRMSSTVIIENPHDALAEPGEDIDLVVVGARGRSGLAARVLGSVADHAVRRAPKPVVVVPVPAPEGA